ncbi:hypothetical protein [Kangiella aquimarina]|uniref:Uncharacterized protein n=1 Tax=Kangiella aquimarina TaxID=261965 RepID=A0ABZ0X231_9GAMM|nr:hypothetical protein [Kangiella aquimarina]WQG84431.1 hypothetical protein SR900_08130 [Kangiella aquimarina]
MSKAKMLLFKRSQVCKLLDIRVGQFEYWFPLFTPSDFDRRALTVQQTFAFSVVVHLLNVVKVNPANLPAQAVRDSLVRMVELSPSAGCYNFMWALKYDSKTVHIFPADDPSIHHSVQTSSVTLLVNLDPLWQRFREHFSPIY